MHLVHLLDALHVNVLLDLHVDVQDPLIHPGVLLHAMIDTAALRVADGSAEQVVRALGEAVLRDAVVEEEKVLELKGG